MGFKCGIVGLPNVGKSTLFNALTQTASAQAENFPFCTIEPNIGEVAVPDQRLKKIADIAQSANTIPARMNFVDIAGLVKGASKGEGLGNQFLANIRETDAIIYVLRCFEDENIIHVHQKIDPLADLETVEIELMLADIESLEKRLPGLEKKKKGQDKEAQKLIELSHRALNVLRKGTPARLVCINDEDRSLWKSLHLLTTKPVLYVANLDENSLMVGNEYSKQLSQHAKQEQTICIPISAKMESELSILDEQEQIEFLKTYGLEEAGLHRLIRAGYQLLDLQTYFTAGPKEARAWTLKKGSTAKEAAGVIHTDFQTGFIRAETISYQDYVEYKGEMGAKEAGKIRSEGKDYIVQNGDVMHFRFNV